MISEFESEMRVNYLYAFRYLWLYILGKFQSVTDIRRFHFQKSQPNAERNCKRMIIHKHNCALNWIVGWWAFSLD